MYKTRPLVFELEILQYGIPPTARSLYLFSSVYGCRNCGVEDHDSHSTKRKKRKESMLCLFMFELKFRELSVFIMMNVLIDLKKCKVKRVMNMRFRWACEMQHPYRK